MKTIIDWIIIEYKIIRSIIRDDPIENALFEYYAQLLQYLDGGTKPEWLRLDQGLCPNIRYFADANNMNVSRIWKKQNALFCAAYLDLCSLIPFYEDVFVHGQEVNNSTVFQNPKRVAWIKNRTWIRYL